MKKLFLLILIIITGYFYLHTLAPSITAGDSGELISSAYTLGIPHPPGYPLHTIIGKIFSLIPIGSIAFRINLMSAFFTLCSLVIFHEICLVLFSSISISFFATLSTGISYTLWSQSLIAEVYTLHVFWVLLLLYVLVKKFSVNFFALLLGIGLCNHHTLLVFVPILIWRLISEKKYNDFSVYILFILGLSLYFYMPLRSLQSPAINWGETHKLANFIKHLSRSQFTNSTQQYNLSKFSSQLLFFYKILFQQISILFLPLAIMGIYYIFLKNKHFSIFLSYLLLSFSLGVILVTNFDMIPYLLCETAIFFIPSYLIFILLSFYSIDVLFFKFKQNKIYFILLSAVLSVYLIISIYINFQTLNKRKDYYLYDYGLNILKTVPLNSKLFLQSNHQTFSIIYLTSVENRFKNTFIFDREENFFPKIFSYYRDKMNFKNRKEIEQYLIKDNPDNIYFGYKENTNTLFPYGFLYITKYKNSNIEYFHTLRGGLLDKNLDSWHIKDNYTSIFLDKSPWNIDILTRDLISTVLFAKVENLAYKNNFREAVDELDKISLFAYDIPAIQYAIGLKYWDIFELEKSVKSFKQVLKYIPDDYETYNNLGLIYSQKKNYPEAIDNFQKAIKSNPKKAEPYYNLGIVYQENNELEKAITFFNKTKEIDLSIVETYYNLGIIYNQLKNKIETENNYLTAINKNPSYILARNNLALFYLDNKKLDKAKIQIETAFSYNTTELITYYNIARIYEEIDVKIALEKWKKYIDKAKNDPREKKWVNIAEKKVNQLNKKRK